MSDRLNSERTLETYCPVQVAIAILYREEKFLMQLRDDIPGILYPGCWGLFGGHLESGETPEAGLIRELEEEINYTVNQPIKLGCYSDGRVIRHVYHAPLTVPIDALVLNEGWDLDLISLEDIRRGSCYSFKARQSKPLGVIHQHILLDFVATNKNNC